MGMNRFFFAALLIFTVSFTVQLYADLPSAKIEDDSSLRAVLRDSWFNETPARVQNKRAEFHTLKGGTRVQVRTESNADEFAIVLARELPGITGGSSEDSSFPGWAQGSWILTRRKSDGNPVRIRVFPRSDPYTYIQFRPFIDDKCQMDVVLYDAYLIRSMPLPVSFERAMILPVEEILAMAGARFPRKYFDPVPGMYRDTREFVSAVRAKLPELQFVDDGAIDENGNYVFINTLGYQNPAFPAQAGGLNCSGFAKWIVDGILKPHTGKLLPVAPLKEGFFSRGSSYTEPWEPIRDPFFGLDWIRNLASAAGTILRSSSWASLAEFEVRAQPFSQVIQRQNGGSAIRPYPGFLPDGGYGFEGLHALLYTLAIDEPGRIYLAAVNNELRAPITASNPRGLPRIRQYFHIAVLVPYFDENGYFRIVVFESAAETSFNFFRNRYHGNYVNLVRIPVDGSFNPD